MGRDIRINPNLNSTVTTSLLPEIVFSGLSASSIKLKVHNEGTVIYEGDSGGLLSIVDNKYGLIHSVSDISGFPIFEVYSYNTLNFGKWDNLAMTIATSSVGIGTITPSTNLHVEGGFRYVDGNETSGYILTSDSNGLASWTASSNLGLGSVNKEVDTRNYTANVTQSISHSLGTSDIIIQCFDSSGNNITPNTMKVTGATGVSIDFTSTLSNVKTVIMG